MQSCGRVNAPQQLGLGLGLAHIYIFGQGGGRGDYGKVDVEVNEEMADAEVCGVNALHHPCVSPAHTLAQLHHQRQARENQLTLYTRSAATHWCQTQSTFYSTTDVCVSSMPCTQRISKRGIDNSKRTVDGVINDV